MSEVNALSGAPLPIVTQQQPLPTNGPHHEPARPQATPAVRRAAEEFESMFLSEMMGPMFEGLSTDGLGGGGMGEEIFRPMLIEQYAKSISHSGGVGLADSIINELNRLQAAVHPDADGAIPSTGGGDPTDGPDASQTQPAEAASALTNAHQHLAAGAAALAATHEELPDGAHR